MIQSKAMKIVQRISNDRQVLEKKTSVPKSKKHSNFQNFIAMSQIVNKLLIKRSSTRYDSTFTDFHETFHNYFLLKSFTF